MDKLKNKNILLIIVFISLAIFLVYLTKNDSNNKTIVNAKSTYIILTDVNDFFTVEGCINRYINALTSKSAEDVIKLLDEEYIEKNSLNKDNVLNKLGSLEGIYTFSAKKIYVQNISESLDKYYVYGLLKKDFIDNNDLGTDYYLIVKIDKSKLLFSVTPYDGDIFKEEF